MMVLLAAFLGGIIGYQIHKRWSYELGPSEAWAGYSESTRSDSTAPELYSCRSYLRAPDQLPANGPACWNTMHAQGWSCACEKVDRDGRPAPRAQGLAHRPSEPLDMDRYNH